MSLYHEGLKEEDNYNQVYEYKYKKIGELYFNHYDKSGNVYLVQTGTRDFEPCQFFTLIGNADNYQSFIEVVQDYLRKLADDAPRLSYYDR